MNQRKTIVLASRPYLCHAELNSALGRIVSDHPGSRFSVYPIACAVFGMEYADPRSFGQGQCR